VSCLFCRIAAGEVEVLRVLEDEHCVAFLDHRPLFPGHVLLVPRTHVATLTDLPDPLLAPLMHWTRALAQAVEEALSAEGAFVAVNNKVSQSVPHLHVHVVPRRRGDGLKGFFWPRHPYRDAAHAEETRTAIAAALRG
jgi:histidine triad (HIT) family protein